MSPRIESMPKKMRVLTPLERRIMRVVWAGGAGNVQKVLQGLTGEPQLAYTTVQTTLNILHRKGKVKRKLVGRAYEYSAIVSQEAADSHAIKDVLQRSFEGQWTTFSYLWFGASSSTPENLRSYRRSYKPVRAWRRNRNEPN
jgi:predicted transcriptional regulator